MYAGLRPNSTLTTRPPDEIATAALRSL